MTFGQIRAIKRILLVVLVTSGAYVSYRVFHGVRARTSDPGREAAAPAVAVSREIQVEQLDSEGRTAWTLKAAESIAQTETSQQFRDVEIRFDAGKERVPVLVTAQQCEIHKDNSVYLQGDVVVRDNTTLRLEADTLRFQRGPDRIWTTDPVRYYREGLVGDAGDMSYMLDEGLLELGPDVSMVLQNRGGAPVYIDSARASLRRGLRLIQFVDEVRVRQTNRRLYSNDLQVYLAENDEEIERVEAYENVDFRMDVPQREDTDDGDGKDVSSRVALTDEPGSKQLLTDRLEMFFRPGGEHLERARAMEGGRLLARLPEGSRRGYHKELQSYTLAFDFDEEGRLSTLRGRGGVTLLLTPVASDAGDAKTVTARALEADFDPLTGELIEARCDRSVTFEQGNVRAESELGTFRSAESVLVLEEAPRLWDDRASLEAKRIVVNVDSGDLEAEGDVRSTSDRSGQGDETAGLFPTSGEEPVYFVSDHVEYARAEDRAVYTGSARAIQGPNRIEANRIELQRAQGELRADGRLRTVFLQKVGAQDTSAEPTVTDAERLVYLSKTNRLEYRGGVVMRSSDMRLSGQSVDVTLGEGGGEVVEVRADGEVDIQIPNGKAGGNTAKYLPNEESMTIQGENAWLENAGKLTEGKQLTFFTGNDKIFVDGRELTRTKTTYSSRPRL